MEVLPENLELLPFWEPLLPVVHLILFVQCIWQVLHHCEFAWSTLEMSADSLLGRLAFDLCGNLWRHFFIQSLDVSDSMKTFLTCLNVYHVFTHLLGVGIYARDPKILYFETRRLQLAYVPKWFGVVEMLTETNDMTFYAWCAMQLAVRVHPVAFMFALKFAIMSYYRHVPALNKWKGYTWEHVLQGVQHEVPSASPFVYNPETDSYPPLFSSWDPRQLLRSFWKWVVFTMWSGPLHLLKWKML